MTNTDYTAPRRGTPLPDKTPISPYDKRELRELDKTQYKRTLLAIAKKIRTTEAQLERELRKLGLSASDNLLDVSINRHRRMAHSPTSVPSARRAETAQSNLRSHYQRWAELCEKHLRATQTDANEDEPL
jgi:hypothetical protein